MWFTLGIMEVLKGWDKGLQDMCSGEKRKLVVPPALAYGKEGKGTAALTIFMQTAVHAAMQKHGTVFIKVVEVFRKCVIFLVH